MSFEDLIKVKPIRNKQELESLINEYLELINNKNLSKDSFDNIIIREKNKIKAEELRRRLIEGIPITNLILVDKIIELITKFLKVNDFDEQLFYKMMKNTDFSIIDFRVFDDSKGLAFSAGKKISFNVSICNFDEKGNFNGIKYENIEFLTHIIFHEMFHRISAFRDDIGDVNARDTALSEGFTDFFAEMLSGYNGQKKKIINFQKMYVICSISY